MHWDDKALYVLKRGIEEGFPYSRIALQIEAECGVSCSRSAVSGKVDRLGLGRAMNRAERAKVNRYLPNRKPRSASMTPDPIATQAPSPDEPVSLNVTMMEVRDGMCRYIAGDPSQGATLCGNPTEIGKSYCQFHQARCYVPIKPYVPQELRG